MPTVNISPVNTQGFTLGDKVMLHYDTAEWYGLSCQWGEITELDNSIFHTFPVFARFWSGGNEPALGDGVEVIYERVLGLLMSEIHAHVSVYDAE